MENILLLIAIILLREKGDKLANAIICFYLLCIASFYALPNVDDFTWSFVQIINDLIVITLCYFSYIITQRLVFVLYILWVITVYLVPECFMLTGVEVWQYDNITMLASIVDVILAGRRSFHGWISRVFQSLRSCYTYLIKRISGNNTGRIRHN